MEKNQTLEALASGKTNRMEKNPDIGWISGFKVIRLEEEKASFLFVCANSRQEIMEKISGDFFMNFGPEIWKEMRFSNPEEAGKETFQIIRMLEDDLEDGKIWCSGIWIKH